TMLVATLHLRVVALASLALAVCSCETAHKPVPLLPSATAPRLNPPAAPAPTTPKVPKLAVKSQTVQPTVSHRKEQEQTKATESQAKSPPPPAPEPASLKAPTVQASDPVAELIARVEAEYQKGLANYDAGKTDAAKENFDTAV